jgi:hypothetical protein
MYVEYIYLTIKYILLYITYFEHMAQSDAPTVAHLAHTWPTPGPATFAIREVRLSISLRNKRLGRDILLGGELPANPKWVITYTLW